MLSSIYIKKFLYFSDINIDLTGGLNVFTGETGAGKSLILDAIQFVLGDDATYEEGTYVELVFEVENQYSEDGTLIVARQIKNGKSVFYLNGRKSVKSTIKEIAPQLIEIHGQHQNQSLFKRDYHRQVLDRFAGLEDQLEEYRQLYTEYRKLWQEIDRLRQKQSERLRTMDILKYQIQELENLNLKPGEKQELERTYQYLKNIQQIKEAVYNSLSLFSDRIIPDLKQAEKLLTKVSQYEEKLSQTASGVEEVLALSEEVYRQLSSFDLSENSSVSEIEERLNQINFLERKYNTDADGLLELLDSFKSELNQLENSEYLLPELEKKFTFIKQQIEEKAEEISQKRKDASHRLENLVVEHLKDLGFLSCEFKVDIKPSEIDQYGKDRVEFMFSANKGFELKPLADIASGGEISRLSLALKVVSKKSVPTMIFDEIDTGIGGKTALSMAKKLKELSKDFQVILITHLPQIAAMSDTHYHVEKKMEASKTAGVVRQLSEEEKVVEIARMLSGNTDKSSIEYAREFIKVSQNG